MLMNSRTVLGGRVRSALRTDVHQRGASVARSNLWCFASSARRFNGIHDQFLSISANM
jgi:hypothetical protein